MPGAKTQGKESSCFPCPHPSVPPSEEGTDPSTCAVARRGRRRYRVPLVSTSPVRRSTAPVPGKVTDRTLSDTPAGTLPTPVTTTVHPETGRGEDPSDGTPGPGCFRLGLNVGGREWSNTQNRLY